MKTLLRMLKAASVVAVLAAGPMSAQAKLKVVATTPDFAAVASEIGGKHVSISTLAKPTEDPHFVDARPSFIVKLNRADAVIEGGADLEIGWLPPLIAQSRNSRLALGSPGRIRCSDGVQLVEVPATLDRSRGDIHAMGNPHFMTDPANARIVAAHLANAFGQLDPKSAGDYSANLNAFTARLDAKIAEWRKELEPFNGQPVVAYHDSWPYFAKAFGLRIDLFLEPKPGIPPTPVHLSEVIARMKTEHIRAIMVEPYQNRKTAETVAGQTAAAVVPATQFPGGVKGTADGYIEMMDYLVTSIAKALGEGRQ